MKKNVSIIGGADGPTAIFVAGRKEKNLLKRIKIAFLNRQYKRKRALAEKSIIPDAHTLEEVIHYIQQRYDAVEADCPYPYYLSKKRSMKYNLIKRLNPKLLGEEKQILPPADFNDRQAVSEWQQQIDAWIKECQEKTDAVSYEVFPTDYHLFIINKGNLGSLEVEMDTLHPTLSISYSGDHKIMQSILKDIYLYFGVSKEDIDRRTERYTSLLSALTFN
ncbi:MAG: sodium ion-translocating decarboxylase subunit beta [Lachnospiraceae bacterium]|nr:sodium ion-translocating decarboxylase subunit beta [Lachnospiraceae bacterium]